MYRYHDDQMYVWISVKLGTVLPNGIDVKPYMFKSWVCSAKLNMTAFPSHMTRKCYHINL